MRLPILPAAARVDPDYLKERSMKAAICSRVTALAGQ
jgi:hypothetical protein